LPERLSRPGVEGLERRTSALQRIRQQVAVGLLDLKDTRSEGDTLRLVVLSNTLTYWKFCKYFSVRVGLQTGRPPPFAVKVTASG